MPSVDDIAASGSTITSPGKRLAVVTGANGPDDSKYISRLKYSELDAEIMSEALSSYCSFEIVGEPLVGNKATTQNIQHAIYELAENRETDDILVFYFSGHGAYIDLGTHKDVYLVTSDFSDDYLRRNEHEHISMKWLKKQLHGKTKAKTVIIILDCCYGNKINKQEQTIEEIAVAVKSFLDDNYGVEEEQYNKNGFRVSLTASSSDGVAREDPQTSHSLMTAQILKLISGEAEDDWYVLPKVTINQLHDYLCHTIPQPKPELTGNLPGDFYLVDNTTSQRVPKLKTTAELPTITWIPREYSKHYQKNRNEFQNLENVLFRSQTPVRLGIVGIPGSGKSELALQIANDYERFFPEGIFWIDGGGVADWRDAFVTLAKNVRFLPSESSDRYDVARRICQILASRSRALLIIDNVEEPESIISTLRHISGEAFQCAIIYTSISHRKSEDFIMHEMDALTLVEACKLLLEGTRPTLLSAIENNQQVDELQAITSICKHIGFLPYMLVQLRALLSSDPDLKIQELTRIVEEKGAFDIAKEYLEEDKLLSTFHFVWTKIKDNNAQQLFKIATRLQTTDTLSLRIIGQAIGLESSNYLGPLWKARRELQTWGLINYVRTTDSIQIHSLAREFGQKLLEADPTLLQIACRNLITPFDDISYLERNARSGYQSFLDQIFDTISYVQRLEGGQVYKLERIAQRLEKEKDILTCGVWPNIIPELFYQQMYNQEVEEGRNVNPQNIKSVWLRKIKPTNIDMQLSEQNASSKRISIKHKIISIYYQICAKRLLTCSTDTIPYLWDIEKEDILRNKFNRNSAAMNRGSSYVALSSSGMRLALGNNDGTVKLWESDSDQPFMIVGTLTIPVDEGELEFGGDGEDYYQSSELDFLFETEATPRVTQIQFIQTDTKIIVGYEDGGVKIWSTLKSDEGGPPLFIWGGSSDEITCMAVSANEDRIVLGTKYGEIYIWNIANEKASFKLAEETGYAITALILSPDESVVLSSSEEPIILADGNIITPVCVFDITNGRQSGILEGHTAPVTVIAFSPDGKLLLTCDRDGWARLWKVDSSISYNFIGIYKTQNSIGVVSWLSNRCFVLVDTGGPIGRPYFYHLEVEGFIDDNEVEG